MYVDGRYLLKNTHISTFVSSRINIFSLGEKEKHGIFASGNSNTVMRN